MCLGAPRSDFGDAAPGDLPWSLCSVPEHHQDTFSSAACLCRKQMPVHRVINPVNRDIDAC